MRSLLFLLTTLAVLAAGAWISLRDPAGDSVREQPVASAGVVEREPLVQRVALSSEDVLPTEGTAAQAEALAAAPRATQPEPELETLVAEPPQASARERRWSDLNRMAIRALEAGDPERASALFEQCVKGVPDEPVFQRNLAEALARRALLWREREQPCEKCIRDLERAVELAPERDDLARLLERWRSEARIEQGFWSESSQHFELAYDGERSELLHGSHRVIEALEAAYTDLALLFGTLPVEKGRARIRVVLYRREGFGSLTGLGDWAGGAFDGTVRVPVEDLAREERGLRDILRHELTHAFVLEVGGPQVPGWLNEGLAQWLESSRAEDLERARAALAGTELFDLEQLQGSLALWKDAEQIGRAYSQSLVLVDFLARQYGERVPFALVAGCAAGKGPEVRFQELTRVPLATALDDLRLELAR